MAFGLLFIGIILAVAAVKGNHKKLFELIKGDFTGDDNFFLWVLSIIILVAIGNIKSLTRITDAALVLIIIVIFVSPYRNRDIFADFLAQIKEGTSGEKSGGGAISLGKKWTPSVFAKDWINGINGPIN